MTDDGSGATGRPASGDRVASDRTAASQIRFGAASDVGYLRPHNEDAWRIEAQAGLLLLADGMGGYNAGEVASALAVETLSQLADAQEPPPATLKEAAASLQQAIQAANQRILEEAARSGECQGMGTTLVLGWLLDDQLVHAHIGDSRLYLLRGIELLRLTRDHSVEQLMLDAGLLEGIPVHERPMRGVLTRALGVDGVAEPDIGCVPLEPGDRLLLCSDGLTDRVGDELIQEVLARGDEPQAIAQRLVGYALAEGGHDNVTVLVAFIEPPDGS